MRIIEITLKLAFLIIAVSFLVTQTITAPLYDLFLVVCIVLGIVLLLSKESSYHFKHSKLDFRLRQIEGAILVIYAALSSTLGF